jgi:hypothetical protein
MLDGPRSSAGGPAVRRISAALALLACLHAATGCSTIRHVDLDSMSDEDKDPFLSTEPLHITAYTTADGERHPCRCTVRQVSPDSLEIADLERTSRRDEAGARLRIERARVRSVEVRDMHEGRTLLLVLGVVTVVLVIVAAFSIGSGWGDWEWEDPDPVW